MPHWSLVFVGGGLLSLANYTTDRFCYYGLLWRMGNECEKRGVRLTCVKNEVSRRAQEL